MPHSTSSSPARTLWPGRYFWLALFVILIGAGGLRYTGYNFSLPYIDHVDEPAYNIAGRMILDSGSAKPIGMQGYPPGIVTINYVLLRFFQQAGTPPGSILGIVRLISISFSMAAIVAIALLAFRIANPLAGLLAAFSWTILPIIVEYSRYGTADNFVTFFVVMALFATLTGTRFDRSGWIFSGVGLICLAVVFKYQAVFALPLIVVIPLWRLQKPGIDRRRVWRDFARAIALYAVFFIWLIVIFPALEATSSPDWSAPTSRLGLPAPATILTSIGVIHSMVANSDLWLIGWFGYILLLWKPWRARLDLFSLCVTVLTFLAWMAGMSFYGVMEDSNFRQYIFAGAALHILQAVGLAGWVVLIGVQFSRMVSRVKFGGYARWRWAVSAVPILAVIIVLLIAESSNIQASVQNTLNHTLPDRRNVLSYWMDTSVPPGAYVASTENHKTFNVFWGGYRGTHSYPLSQVAPLWAKPVAEWRAAGVAYAILRVDEYDRMVATQAGRDALAQTLILKTYPESPAFRGPAMVIVRLWRNQYSVSQQIGALHLIGYDLTGNDLVSADLAGTDLAGFDPTKKPTETSVSPGEQLKFTWYWRADRALDADYAVFNHLINMATGELVAQVDGDPMADSRRQTTAWDDPDEVLISQPFSLPLSANLAPGTYQLRTGFYRRDTGVRLTDSSGADYFAVTLITVK